MSENLFNGTGRRKTSVARVWLRPGKGSFKINNREINEYFPRESWQIQVREPLELTETDGQYDILVNVQGGGLTGQAEAIRHGITKALVIINPDYRSIFRKASLLTRDSRIKERKKYGLKGARARFQFSKR